MRFRIFYILIGGFFAASAQHNADILQYMFNPHLINPAYAGNSGAMDLTGLYKKQWAGFDGAPVTAAFIAHTPLRGNKSNLGVQVINDAIGAFNYRHASLSYAYRIQLKESRLAFGLRGGLNHYVTDWSRVRLLHPNDPGFSPDNQRVIIPSAGAGAYFSNPSFYAGIGAPELLNGSSRNQRTLVAHSGFLVPLSNTIILKPAVLAKYIAGSPVFLNLSAVAYYRQLMGLGLGYTHGYAANAIIDLRINEQFRFGYGYEYSMNQLKYYNMGTHEIMLRYIFNYKVESAEVRYF